MGSSYGRTVLRTTLVGLAVATVLGGVLASPVSAAPAAPAQQCGGNTSVAPTLTPSRTTVGQHETATITVTGSNYLVPPHVCGSSVFGGVYVAFGWVKPGGQWGPSWRSSTSATGLFGQTYSYPGEGGGAETRGFTCRGGAPTREQRPAEACLGGREQVLLQHRIRKWDRARQ